MAISVESHPIELITNSAHTDLIITSYKYSSRRFPVSICFYIDTSSMNEKIVYLEDGGYFTTLQSNRIMPPLVPYRHPEYTRALQVGVPIIPNEVSLHSQDTVCFGMDSHIRIPKGKLKLVSKLNIGDEVQTPYGITTILRIVYSLCTVPIQMVLLNNDINNYGTITPWHPIIWNERWQFPIHVEELNKIEILQKFVISLQIAEYHQVYIGDIICATLGHGLKGQVIEHAYYGTNKVIDDLSKFRNRIIYINTSNIRRNEFGEVISIIPAEDLST
jgi:hypothetical protein